MIVTFQIHFIEIAYGSLNEVMCQIELAHDLHFINAEQLLQIEQTKDAIAQALLQQKAASI